MCFYQEVYNTIPGYLLLPVIDKYYLSNGLGNSLGLQMGALLILSFLLFISWILLYRETYPHQLFGHPEAQFI